MEAGADDFFSVARCVTRTGSFTSRLFELLGALCFQHHAGRNRSPRTLPILNGEYIYSLLEARTFTRVPRAYFIEPACVNGLESVDAVYVS